MIIIILCVIAWYVIGVLGFIYWWTTDFDYTLEELGLSLAMGLGGPLIWIIGFSIHKKSSVIIKSRKKVKE